MKIYIVDSSEQYREAIKIYLTQVLGHKVAGEAEDGLQFLKNYRYNNDIVLIDVDVPVINGVDAIKRALEKDRRIKAIAVGLDFDKLSLNIIEKVGFVAYVPKSKIIRNLPVVLSKVESGEFSFTEKENAA